MNLSFYRLDALVQTPHSSDSSLLSYLLGLYTSVKKKEWPKWLADWSYNRAQPNAA